MTNDELLWDAFHAMADDLEEMRSRVAILEVENAGLKAALDGNDAVHDWLRGCLLAVRTFAEAQMEVNNRAEGSFKELKQTDDLHRSLFILRDAGVDAALQYIRESCGYVEEDGPATEGSTELPRGLL
jgi:hypothetical protein